MLCKQEGLEHENARLLERLYVKDIEIAYLREQLAHMDTLHGMQLCSMGLRYSHKCTTAFGE